jgi:hypothetical protein
LFSGTPPKINADANKKNTDESGDISFAAALCLAILIGVSATAFSAETGQLPAWG